MWRETRFTIGDSATARKMEIRSQLIGFLSRYSR
jgi:hypothetical protein